jgi:uncharacterized RmlC-like cupin family protein
MRRIALAVMITGLPFLYAADPAGFMHWNSAALKAFEKSLAPKINAQKVATEKLGDFGNHSALMVHRQGDGEVELHENQADVMVVQSGEARLVVGGVIIDGRTTAPGEIRGRAIEGGGERKLAAGDMVQVAAKVPHQVLVAQGQQITYVVIKVDSK